MTPYSEIIPAAPYRVLEAIWYESIHNTLKEELFVYPYRHEDEFEIDHQYKFRKTLIKLTGTELHFVVHDHSNHQADVFIQVTPVRKNESKVEYTIENSSLNGTQGKVLGWILETIQTVSEHYIHLRKTA